VLPSSRGRPTRASGRANARADAGRSAASSLTCLGRGVPASRTWREGDGSEGRKFDNLRSLPPPRLVPDDGQHDITAEGARFRANRESRLARADRVSLRRDERFGV
jgi:hypothetical protein